MRRKAVVISTFVLVFALIFTACAARRPLQTPSQTGQNRTGMYGNYNRTGTGTTGTGTTGVGTRTGVGTNYYTGNGPSASDPYDLGYGAGNNAGYRYGGYNYGNTAGNPNYYGGYDNGLYGGYGVDYRNTGGSNNSPNYRYFNNTGMNGVNGTNQADNIKRAVEQMTGVNNASVVVSGNTAYVALNTNASTSGQNITYGNVTGTTAIKQACAQRVRSANPQIRTVYVSTDANFAARLRAVENGVRAGSPVSSFFNELGDLVRGMTPQRQ
ncbi:MAG: YhcN/YlaJ family sporulation lipoprotein [Pseudomonadota bacterium]